MITILILIRRKGEGLAIQGSTGEGLAIQGSTLLW